MLGLGLALGGAGELNLGANCAFGGVGLAVGSAKDVALQRVMSASALRIESLGMPNQPP